jgi:hypothetical protein
MHMPSRDVLISFAFSPPIFHPRKYLAMNFIKGRNRTPMAILEGYFSSVVLVMLFATE